LAPARAIASKVGRIEAMKARTNSRQAAPKRARRNREVVAEAVATERADAVVVPFVAAGASQITVLALPADCTARGAGNLKTSLVDRLETAACVGIDVTAVERVDTVCLQLLVAFARDRQKAGRDLEWQGRSAAFTEAVDVLGLASILDPSAGMTGAG